MIERILFFGLGSEVGRYLQFLNYSEWRKLSVSKNDCFSDIRKATDFLLQKEIIITSVKFYISTVVHHYQL